MKTLLFLLIPISLLSSCQFLLDEKGKEGVHYHAGFQIYYDNKLEDFSDVRYMSIKPCEAEDTHDDSSANEDKVHLHDGVGDVVHVHRPQVVWRDLIQYLDYALPASFSAYLNGKEVMMTLEEIIMPYDSLVLFIGDNTEIETKLETSVTREAIEKAEQMSEMCDS